MSKLTDILEAIPLCEAYMDGVDDGCNTCPYNGRCKDLVPDTIKMLEDLAKRVPRWISVEERLPEELVPVLIYEPEYARGYKSMATAFRINGCWHGCVDGAVTHWMPLPELPKEDIND